MSSTRSHSKKNFLCLFSKEINNKTKQNKKKNFNDLISKFIPLLGPVSKHLITWGTQQERQQAAQQHDQLRRTTRNVTLSLDCSDFLIERRRGDHMRGPDGM
jgi:hypothetical protein